MGFKFYIHFHHRGSSPVHPRADTRRKAPRVAQSGTIYNVIKKNLGYNVIKKNLGYNVIKKNLGYNVIKKNLGYKENLGYNVIFWVFGT